MRTMPAVLACVFSGAALMSACSGKREVVIENDAHPASIEVLVDGQSVGSFSGREVRLEIPKKSPKKDGITYSLLPDPGETFGGAVLVRVQTACGPVTFHGRDPREDSGLRFRFSEADLGRRPGQPNAFMDLEEVWFDNRGGAPTELKVGSFRYEIAAGTSGPRAVPGALCPEEQSVSLGGVPIGIFPLASRRLSDNGTRDRSAFIVDASGSRCYDETTYQYGLSSGGPSGRVSRTKKLHALETSHVDYFLEKAPDVIGTMSGGGSRTQVVECPASGG